MLSLRNIQAQGPDSQFFRLQAEEEISQNKQQDFLNEKIFSVCTLSLWERAGVRASDRTPGKQQIFSTRKS